MKETVYHVVTERPMRPGQVIRFGGENRSGVYRRVMEKTDEVRAIYAHPEAYDAETLPHHTSVALRELALEKVRLAEFSAYPSRLACLYVSRTFEEAEKWAELFVLWGRPTWSIVKMEVNGRCFIGDAEKCFPGQTDEEENLRLARIYWQNPQTPDHPNGITELLADGEITVLEIVKEINANIEG